MKLKRITLVAAVAALGSGLFLLRNEAMPAGQGGMAEAAATAVAPAIAVAPPSPQLRDAATTVIADAPPDVPAEEWHRLKAALPDTPQGRRDLQQAGEYLGYQHRLEKWQQLKGAGGDATARAALAQSLLDELPTHVARRELTAYEAQMLVQTLLQDRIDDPAVLAQAVQAELQKLQAAQPAPAPEQSAQQQARLAAYQQQEAAIVAAWQALPPAQRSQQALESQLDAARRNTLAADAL